jgi:hypothetical protein
MYHIKRRGGSSVKKQLPAISVLETVSLLVFLNILLSSAACRKVSNRAVAWYATVV